MRARSLVLIFGASVSLWAGGPTGTQPVGSGPTGASGDESTVDAGIVLEALEAELARAQKGLVGPEEIRPYHIQLEVEELTQDRLVASWGDLVQDSKLHTRSLDVDLRVGSPELDNTHELRGERERHRTTGAVLLPLEDGPAPLRVAVWTELDRQFKEAVERLSRVKAAMAVTAEAEDVVADFSSVEPQVFIEPAPGLPLPRREWEERVRRLSRRFLEVPWLYDSNVTLEASVVENHLASSDGTRLRHGQTQLRLSIYAATRTETGMEHFLYDGWEAREVSGLPEESEVVTAVERVIQQLADLREAPEVEPYSGPALLSGRAAAVFFHEIFGHRIEGHRQKSEDEGQTFTRQVGLAVLPDFLTVLDDPTRARFDGVDLMGHYRFDDEGVPSERVTVVESGELKTFLMSRSPVPGFDRSNGHGRRQAGYPPVGRQGNLMIENSQPQTDDDLRARLKELVREQDKPFGLYFADISGGFTFTQRAAPQSYKVLPLLVYRVYPDDRPDELVSGADIVGTPLQSFARIVGAGDTSEVFNGFCGAESGYIPVSAVSPPILVSELEIEKRAKGVERPPILEPPPLRGEEDPS